MGIFQSRPEEPEDWAGLPSEPWRPRSPGEVLPPPLGDAGALGPDGLSSISLDLSSIETETSTVEAGDGDGD